MKNITLGDLGNNFSDFFQLFIILIVKNFRWVRNVLKLKEIYFDKLVLKVVLSKLTWERKFRCWNLNSIDLLIIEIFALEIGSFQNRRMGLVIHRISCSKNTKIGRLKNIRLRNDKQLFKKVVTFREELLKSFRVRNESYSLFELYFYREYNLKMSVYWEIWKYIYF